MKGVGMQGYREGRTGYIKRRNVYRGRRKNEEADRCANRGRNPTLPGTSKDNEDAEVAEELSMYILVYTSLQDALELRDKSVAMLLRFLWHHDFHIIFHLL